MAAVAAGSSGRSPEIGLRTTRIGLLATGVTDLRAPGFARGSPTSAGTGGGSGARSSPGTSRSASSATRTIAAARATPRHLIRTLAIPS
jgi:hypothetical protein